MAGTAVQFAPKSDGGPVNRSSVEKFQESPGFTDGESVKVSRINESSGETLRIREQLRAADRQDDLGDMTRYWDQLKRDKAASIIDGEISRPANNPSTATISSNEIDENFSRIREEGRAADRQDDLGDMTRYWDQLKRDAASGSRSYYDEDENERLYDELRQSFTGIPYNGSGREDLRVDRAWWPFGSLLPDTEYYRNPDFDGRQMRPSSK
jgi:hypothetical protein